MKIMKKVLALVLTLAILSVPMIASAAVGDGVSMPSTCIYSGETVTIAPGETGYFEIGTNNTPGTYDFVVEGIGDFTLATCTEGTGDYPYAEGTPVAAVDGKAETTITSYESTYGYAAFAITNLSEAEVSYVCTIVFPLGSQGNPAPVTLELYEAVEVTVAAGEQYFINATLPQMRYDYLLTVGGNTGFRVGAGMGMPTPDTNGVVTTNANAFFGTYGFSIINTTGATQTYNLTLSEHPIGSMYNPEELYIGGTVTAELDGNEYFYTTTASKSGTLKFTISGESDWTYKLEAGTTVYNYSTGWGEADKNVCLANVAAGDTITVSISVPTYYEALDSYDVYTFASGTIEFSTKIGTYGDVNVDGEINVEDLKMVRKALLGTIYVSSYTPGAYDVNADETFNINDLIRTKKRIAGVITIGDPIAVPSYEYCVYSPAEVTVPANSIVYYEISTNGMFDSIPFNVTGLGDFSVVICEEDGNGAYKVKSLVDAVDGAVATNIQGYESTNGYACFAIINKTDADVTYNCILDFPLGSESNPAPITLWVGESVTVTVPADSQYYIEASLPEMGVDYLLTITGNTGFGIPSAWGMPTWDTDGSLTVTANAYYGIYNTSIVNNTDSEQTYTLYLENMPIGTEANPDSLEVDTTYTLELDGNDYYYTWTAPYDGTITFTVDNEKSKDGWTYKAICGDSVLHFSTGWDEAHKNVASFDVAAGDVVTYGVSVPDGDPYIFGTGTVEFTVDYSIVLEENDAVAVPSYLYCIESGNTVTVPAGKTLVYEISTSNMYDVLPLTVTGSGDFSVMICGEDGNGAYVANTFTAATDGVYSGNIQGYESTYGYACFAITNNSDADADYTCEIAFPYGSQSNPVGVTLSVGGTATVTVPAGSQYYIAAAFPQIGVDYLLTVTGNTGFGISSGWGMPTWDNDGSLTVTANAYYGKYNTSIINNTDTEQTYTLSLANMPLGAKSNPDILEVNKTYTLNLVDSAYYYTWTATEAGTLVITLDNDNCTNGWTYDATHNDMGYQFSTGWDESDRNVLTLEIAAGDIVTYGVMVPADYPLSPASGTIVFNVEFTAAQ